MFKVYKESTDSILNNLYKILMFLLLIKYIDMTRNNCKFLYYYNLYYSNIKYYNCNYYN